MSIFSKHALLLCTGAAVPVVSAQQTSLPEYNPDTARRALSFAKASNCDESELAEWSCLTCTDPEELGVQDSSIPSPVAQADVTVSSAARILGLIDTDTIWVMTYDSTLHSVVLAFRGTDASSPGNWFVALDTFEPAEYSDGGCQGCRVHNGFYDAWSRSLESGVLDPIAGLMEQYDTNKMLVTGHGLGGAYATFAAAHLATTPAGSNMDISVYTFGQPRVGNFQFAKHVVTKVPAFFRVVHDKDPVAHVPASTFHEFTHIPREVFYKRADGTGMTLCSDWNIADLGTATKADFEDPACSFQFNFNPLALWNHMKYLGVCTKCECPSELPPFCWLDSYGRGVGTLPQTCGPGQEHFGLGCYDECPINTWRIPVVGSCETVCPDDFIDHGLFCRVKDESYGRGWGYVSTSDCEEDEGRGQCEKWGLLLYPKCEVGYHNFGCCICIRDPVDCPAFNMVDVDPLGLGCGKGYIGLLDQNPAWPDCAADKEWDAALCYPHCEQGYDGVGPVCWSGAPDGYVSCGMGAAKDSETCWAVVEEQAFTPLVLFAEVVAPAFGVPPGTAAELTGVFREMLTEVRAVVDDSMTPITFDEIGDLDTDEQILQLMFTLDSAIDGEDAVDRLTPAEIARYSAQLVSLLSDPEALGQEVLDMIDPLGIRDYIPGGDDEAPDAKPSSNKPNPTPSKGGLPKPDPLAIVGAAADVVAAYAWDKCSVNFPSEELAPVSAPVSASSDQPFCWQRTYSREATAPQACPTGSELFGLACYTKCPEGYDRDIIDGSCTSTCPHPFESIGRFTCKVKESQQYYWLPDSYADDIWWNPGLTTESACEHYMKVRNCEYHWGMLAWYPACKKGFEKNQYKKCWMIDPVDCGAYDLEGSGDGYICSKRDISASELNPTWPTCVTATASNVTDGVESDGAYCYPKCREGYTGVGPQCWSTRVAYGSQLCEFGGAGGCVNEPTMEVMTLARRILTTVSRRYGGGNRRADLSVDAKPVPEMFAQRRTDFNKLLGRLKTLLDTSDAITEATFNSMPDGQAFLQLIQDGTTTTTARSSSPTAAVAPGDTVQMTRHTAHLVRLFDSEAAPEAGAMTRVNSLAPVTCNYCSVDAHEVLDVTTDDCVCDTGFVRVEQICVQRLICNNANEVPTSDQTECVCGPGSARHTAQDLCEVCSAGEHKVANFARTRCVCKNGYVMNPDEDCVVHLSCGTNEVLNHAMTACECRPGYARETSGSGVACVAMPTPEPTKMPTPEPTEMKQTLPAESSVSDLLSKSSSDDSNKNAILIGAIIAGLLAILAATAAAVLVVRKRPVGQKGSAAGSEVADPEFAHRHFAPRVTDEILNSDLANATANSDLFSNPTIALDSTVGDVDVPLDHVDRTGKSLVIEKL